MDFRTTLYRAKYIAVCKQFFHEKYKEKSELIANSNKIFYSVNGFAR